jgi:hypothetical protein
MGFTEGEMAKFREALSSAARPLILFDDDPDGLSSFLMVYGFVNDGKGIPVKNAPEVGVEFARIVNDHSPDLVVILDMPLVSQDFLDEIHTKVIWLDHHPPIKRHGVDYYNPRVNDPADNRPTSYWIYRILGNKLWVAMTGMVGDWFMPEDEIRDQFIKEYPGFLPPEIRRPEQAIHDTKIGTLVRVLSFNLKGKSSDVIKSMKVLTRIKDPLEILEEKSPAGKFIYKKYAKLRTEYDAIMKQVKLDPDDKLAVFIYQNDSYSFSPELSNEMIYRHPEKIVLVAWKYGGEYKCSLRSTKVHLPDLITKALEGVHGYGGGHDHAAGACIKEDDFEVFVENIRRQL